MHLNFMALAVPVFIFFIIVEFAFSRFLNRKVYSFKESIANLNVGIAERVCSISITGIFFLLFTWVNKNYSLFHIKSSVANWVLLFIATDFIYYWYHRCGHKINILWCVHIVHHQSEDFNYTTSVRVTVFQAFVRGAFWTLLPLIGFPVEMTTIVLLLHGTFPFFSHTQLIKRMGFLELIIVTPSHHRVHHSSNSEYLDKNYGNVLIIWDKIFGTFAKEQHQIAYGLTRPLSNTNFLWQHFHSFWELSVAVKMEKSWKKKYYLIFGRPSNMDLRVRTQLEDKIFSKRDFSSPTAAIYKLAIVQTTLTLLVLFFNLLFSYYFSNIQFIILAIFIFVNIIYTGLILEGQEKVIFYDMFKIFLVGAFVFTYWPCILVSVLTLSILLLLFIYYRRLSNYYHNLFSTSGCAPSTPAPANL